MGARGWLGWVGRYDGLRSWEGLDQKPTPEPKAKVYVEAYAYAEAYAEAKAEAED